MKKRNWLFVILTFVLCLTGCVKTGGEVFRDSLDAMDELDSVKVKLTSKVEAQNEGVAVNIDLPVNISIDGEKVAFDTENNTFIGELDFYGIIDDTKIVAYFLSSLLGDESNTWLKVAVTEEDLNELFTEEDLKEIEAISEKLENLDIAKILQEDKFVYIDREDDIKHYELIIDDELIERLNKALEEETEKINTTIKLDFYIDTKTKYITKIEADLKEVMSSIMLNSGEMTEEELALVTKVFVTVEFSDFNTTTVTIPSEAINNAKDYEDYINDFEPNEDIYEDIYFDENFGGNVIEGDFNYDKENVYEYEY